MSFKRYITIGLILFNLVIAYSQNTGKITGKLIVKDIENKESIFLNTYIILKTKTHIDTVRIDENLTFSFENLKADTLRIYISPRSYPTNTFYKFYLKDGEIKNIEIPYSPVCPYEKNKTNTCPICKKKDKVIPIIYGLHLESKGKKKSKSGGCVVSDCQPKWYCERDKNDF